MIWLHFAIIVWSRDQCYHNEWVLDWTRGISPSSFWIFIFRQNSMLNHFHCIWIALIFGSLKYLNRPTLRFVGFHTATGRFWLVFVYCTRIFIIIGLYRVAVFHSFIHSFIHLFFWSNVDSKLYDIAMACRYCFQYVYHVYLPALALRCPVQFWG